MRYLILSVSLLLFIPFMAPAFGIDWYDSNWLKARKISVDGADFDSTLTDYPLYVNITSVGVGEDTQADCDDIIFVKFENNTKLSHEIENCDATANWIEAWVNIPLAYTNGTDIFMYYDNAGASDQQSTQATWNSNYKMVQHLNGTFLDSTSNTNTCTNSGTSAVTNEYIGDSRDWDVVDDYINCGSGSTTDNIFDAGGTISLWFNPDSAGETGSAYVVAKRGAVSGYGIFSEDELGADMDIRFYADFGTDGDWRTTAREVQENQWNNLVITYDDDSAANNPIFYIDGVALTVGAGLTETLAPTGSYTGDAANIICLGNTLSAATTCATTRTVDGGVDDVRYVNTILSADWVKADWECQKGGTLSSEGPEFSCITVGAEGTEAGGAAHSQDYAESAAITDDLVFTGTGSQAYSESATITDALTFTSTGMQDYLESATITDDLVFIYNDLNPDFIENATITDVYAHLCAGTCGAVATNNAIVISVNKAPFLLRFYSDATRMTCDATIEGGVIWNTDDFNLNICDGTNWILPNGTAT